MCGITGIFDTRERRDIARDTLARMNDSQRHRGPDEEGYHLEPGVGLGHRRLSIIDIATGQQPLYNEDRSVVVVFNGEIYNYQELIPELVAPGPHVSHAQRYRSHRPCVGGVGRSVRRAVPRHVCVRSVGSQSGNAIPRPRSTGRQAAVLRVAARRQVHLRIRAEVASRPRRLRPANSIRVRSRNISLWATSRSRARFSSGPENCRPPTR